MRNEFRYNGVPLNQWGLRSLLRTFGYSRECIAMLSGVVGFAGPFLSSSNAGDALQILLDFPSDPKFHAFNQGFSTLTDALTAQIQRHHVPITIGTTVTALTARPSGRMRAEWRSTPGVYPGVHEHGHIDADRIILALPKNAIETLSSESPLLMTDPAAWQRLRQEPRFCRRNGAVEGQLLL
ncbi:hypothetical protein PEC18_35050 [Paucibacter sp. O1-1]|nr:hypothetical protein [Paucibacter sp. O1-1]MDA3830895.1 hypothetical protein [Paucibacter sp. O1-1]